MIPNAVKGRWYYLEAKKLSTLLRGITCKHQGGFYCLNYFHYFVTENKLESHEKGCENKDFRNVIMPSDDTQILEFNQYQKSDKWPFIIYADPDCITEKIDGYKNNPENSPATKVSQHIPSDFSMPGISLFRSIKNRPDVYRGKDLQILKRGHNENNWCYKEKNENINKWAGGIIWKCKSLLYL